MRISRSLLLSISLVFPCSFFGQSTNAALTGVVDDPSKAVIAAAQITAINTETGVKSSTTTNNSGVYVLPGLIPGTYRIEVDKQGFKGIIQPGLVLHVQDVVQLNFHMALGSMTETVTVEANGVNMNTTDAAVSTVVDHAYVEDVPLNGRSLQSLISLAPGVAVVPSQGNGVGGEFTVNGQRTEGNYYTVDGVSANTGVRANVAPGSGGGFNGSTPAQTVAGTTQAIASLDAIQEFRLQTSTYSAEYGRTPGGQFAFVTRSGTNDWHGSAFDYFRNDMLDANNWFSDAAGLPKPPERQNDFGGAVGGPVTFPGVYTGRDHTFFFFSYEGLRLRLPQPALTTQVPTSAFREAAPLALQPILNAYPVASPSSPDLGDGLAAYTAAYSNPSSFDAYSLRIDHSFTDRLKLFGRLGYTPSTGAAHDIGNLAQIDANSSNVRLVTAGLTQMYSPSLNNDFRFNFTQNHATTHESIGTYGGAEPFQPSQVPGFEGAILDSYRIIVNFNFGSGPNVRSSRYFVSQKSLNLTDIFGISKSRHTLRFGLDYRRIESTQGYQSLFEALIFGSQQDVLQNNGLGVAISTLPTPFEPVFANVSTFAQDEWRVSPRLTLSLGLRWEINPAPSEANGNLPYTVDQITNLATTQLAPRGTPLWQTSYRNFAPRLGTAFSLTKNTVFRGGFGIFYDLGSTQGAEGAQAVGFGSRAIYPGTSFPLLPTQLQLPTPSIASPYTSFVFAFDPHLKSPYTWQWNLAMEHAFGTRQSLTASYVGAAGRRLTVERLLNPANVNQNFSLDNGLYLTTNRATSDYDALQVQYQARLSHTLRALVSYTWSHSIDEASTNFQVDELLRASSDFDIRHNVQGGIAFDIPGTYRAILPRTLFSNWAIDGRLSARSALPVDIFSGYFFDSTGTREQVRADVIPRVPVYVHDPTAPGGRVINFNAFSVPANGAGNAPRNLIRGFDAVQMDLALRRAFSLGDRVKLQFRAEAFNLLNHPNFGNIDNSLPDGPTFFGRSQSTLNQSLGAGSLSSLYQIGGPRSLQLALRLLF